MTTYEVVNATVIRRRRDGVDAADALPKGEPRKLPRIADEVKRDFRAHNRLGRRSRSTR